MANLNVTGNFSTSSNTLNVSYTTDAQNITKMEITKDNTNFITADSFTNSSAVFNVSTWDNGTYTCKLRMTHTEDVNNFTFTKNKRLDNGIVTDSEDGTYYTTVNKNSVTSGASYTISINSAKYMCICFYDSNDNYLGNDTGGYIETHTDDWSVKALSTTFTVPSGASYLRVCATGNETQITGTLTNNGSSTPSTPGSDLLDSNGAYMVDDFTGTSLDSSKWSYELGHVRNNELQNYTNINDVVSDGLIALRGLKDGSGNWTSSSIISVNKFTFMYGRIEARIKVDISPGSFGAFWTLGDCFEFQYVENDKPGYLAPLYPESGEFDVMEYYNGKLTCGIYLDDGTEVGRTWYTDYNANEWHTYAMEWHEDGSMELYIDDHLISSTSASNNSALHIPHYILLNQAIGAAGGTPDSNDTEITQYVDWVKYYPLSTDNLSLYSTDFNLYLASQNDEEHDALVRVTYNDNCINKVLNWSSSNPTLLSVHNGYVTTYSGANGSAVITATSNTGVSRSITLYVNNGVIRDTDTPIISESLVFTQYKEISEGDGSVIDTSNNTFYTTVDKTSVTPNLSYTITLNSGNYILVCFYDSNGNILEGDIETNTPDWSYQAGFSITFTVPANASHIRVLATNNSQVTGTLTKIQ